MLPTAKAKTADSAVGIHNQTSKGFFQGLVPRFQEFCLTKILKKAKIAGIFGACSVPTQAILFAYPVDKQERTHRYAIAKL